MNRSQFQASEPLMADLRAIFETPAWKYAEEIVLGESFPASPKEKDGNLMHQMAIAGAESMGAHNLIRRLKTLCSPPQQKARSEDCEYDEAAVRQMVNSGLYTEEQAKQAALEFRKQQTQSTL